MVENRGAQALKGKNSFLFPGGESEEVGREGYMEAVLKDVKR